MLTGHIPAIWRNSQLRHPWFNGSKSKPALPLHRSHPAQLFVGWGSHLDTGAREELSGPHYTE